METYTLDKLPIYSTAKIEALNCNENITRRLLDLGIIKNTTIIPILKSPSGDTRAYRVRGSTIALRSEDSKNIIIK